MNCDKFTDWLENRDLHDVSESDKAMKHAAECSGCMAKLEFDEKLDELLFASLQPVDMPQSLMHKIDLNLEGIGVQKKKSKRLNWYGAVSALLVASFVFFLSFPFSEPENIASMDELGKYVIYNHDYINESHMVVKSEDEMNQLGGFDMPFKSLLKNFRKGYTFLGARICPLGDCQSVHVIYDHDNKRVSVYLVRAEDVDFRISEGKKYSVNDGSDTVHFWRNGDYILAMIS